MKSVRKVLLASALAGTMFAGTQAQALTFTLTDTGGTAVGTQARQGFEIAAAYWASVFSDNVNINLNIGFQSLGAGILGSTGSTRSLLSMNQGYTALAADASSTLDAAAVASLRPLGTSTSVPGAGAVTAIANIINGTNNGYLDSGTRIDNDGSVNNSTLAVTKASAKALGLTTDVNGTAINYASSDGNITFSTNFTFDFDPTDGISSNAFDFIGVAIHEIGHALGFVSGVDSFDARTGPGGPQATAGLLEGFVVMSQLDLFRYSSAGNLDWSTSDAAKYFSIDGGASQLFGDSRFSLGSFNGDGRQASHWKDSLSGVPQLGILDPTSGLGQEQEVTALDLSAYDAIGYNVRLNTLLNSGYRLKTSDIYRMFAGAGAVPEPASWAMMISGFGLIGGAMRRSNLRKPALSAA
jgi:hypothetical protein